MTTTKYTPQIKAALRMIRAKGALCTLTPKNDGSSYDPTMDVFGSGAITLAFLTALAGSGSQIFSGSGAISESAAVASTGSQIFSGDTAVSSPDAVAAAGDNGIFFVYNAGDSLAAATFARASTAMYADINGLIQTASSGTARDGHYIAGVRTLLLEASRTNVVLRCCDLTNASWTKSNVTAAMDQTGPDGVASSASKITASAGLGTCLQAITLGSSARFQSAYVKRITGTGTIEMTMDNGATWTAVVPTASWALVSIPTQTLANPTVGFRITTNGDAIGVAFVQNENGAFGTMPIPTTTASVTRSADSLSFPFATVPQSMTLYIKGVERGTFAVANQRYAHIGSSTISATPRLSVLSNAGLRTLYENTSLVQPTATTGVTIGDTYEIRATLSALGEPQAFGSVNGGAEASSTLGAGQAIPGAWADTKLWLNSGGSTSPGYFAFQSVKVVRNTPSLAAVRTFA